MIIEALTIDLSETFRPLLNALVPFLILIMWLNIILFLITTMQKRGIRNKIQKLAAHSVKMTPREFFKMRNKSFGGKGKPLYANNYNFTGIYILHNVSKNLYYIGQGKKVLHRINAHFTGKGNGDIYADYKYDDEFTIQTIALNGSDYMSLDELEKDAIQTYMSTQNVYNRNRGNKHYV